MKLKGSSGVSVKTIGLMAVIVYVLLTAVRIYQTFSLTDGTTGFFYGSDITVPLMYILAVVPVILFLVFCFVSKDLPAGGINKKASLPAGIVGFLFAISLLADGFASIKPAFSHSGDSALIKEALGGNVGIVAAVFAFLGALTLFIQSMFTIKGKAIPSFLKIPMLFPVLWAFAKTLGFFSITVSYVKVSQLLLTIFASVFLMLFLFENARIASDIGKKDSLWFFFATGIIAAGLAFASCIPSLLASLFSPEKVCNYCPFELHALMGGIYTLSRLFLRNAEELADNIPAEAEASVSDNNSGNDDNTVNSTVNS